MFRRQRNVAKIVAFFCVAVLTAFTGIAQADDGGWNGKHPGEHHRQDLRKISKQLGLTAAQKEQAKAIFEGNREVIKPILVNLRAEHKLLQQLMHSDPIDEAAIRAETARIMGILADLNVNRAKVNAQFRAILTPSQLATLKALHEKRHKKEGAALPPAE